MIRLTVPDVGEEELEAVRAVFATGMLVQGEQVAAFEAAVARRLGVAHAVACSSGTAALHLALTVLGIGPGDEVLVPAFTFPATGNAAALCGAQPVLVDVRPGTYAMDPRRAAERVSEHTRAVVPVHPFGLSADLEPILALAAERGLAVVEDAACALGADYQGRPCGTLGRMGCFSFHPRKAVTTGEGGMVVTGDGELARRLRALRNHGLERRQGRVECIAPGFNYRLTDFQAAIGLVQLGKLEGAIAARRRLAARYRQALEPIPWLTPPAEPQDRGHVYQSYVVTVSADRDRDALIAALREREVETTIGTYALNALDYYRRAYGAEPADCPVAYSLSRSTLALPLYAGMGEEAVDQVAEALRNA
ncbi:MAG: DegT/DnrJ/EryC1/StrS family aminotransferase [Candidatus Brocadiia bacterium]